MPTELQNRINKLVFALFLLLVFSLGFMKPSVDVAFAPLTPTDLIFPFVFLCWIATVAVGVYRLHWQPAYWALAAYFAAVFLSSMFSVKPWLSFGKLAGVLYLVLLCVATASLVTTLERLRMCILVWLAGAVFPILTAFIGLVVFYVAPETQLLADITYHYGSAPVYALPRISSTFISASMFCNYLTVTVVLALTAARMKWIGKTVAIVLIISIGIAAALTASIALGGLFLAVGVWFWFAGTGRILPRLALGSGISLAIAFLAIAPVELAKQLVPPLAPSSRLLVWRDALNTFVAHPIFGKGLGTGAASVAYQNAEGTWSLLTDAHNMFLNVAAESGIIGLAALIAIIIAILRSASSGRDSGGELRLVRIGLGIAFVSAFLYDGLTGAFEDARHLWVLIGLILATEQIAKSSNTPS